MLARALERALKGGPLSARLAEAAKRVTPKLKLLGGVGGLEGEAALELGNVGAAPASDALLRIDDLMGRLASGKRHVLVLLDEVQELATDAKNAALIAALRTSLDTRKNRIAAVFTGSSRDGLNTIFARRAAPFFQFATPIELTPLSEPFVDHLLATFTRVTGETLNRKIVLDAFEAGHRSPFFLRKLLELVALDPERDVVRGAHTLRARLAADLGYDRIWLTLAPLQRTLLAHLALGGASPFSEASRKQVGDALGGSVPSAAQL